MKKGAPSSDGGAFAYYSVEYHDVFLKLIFAF
jgi:hypothetical protein